MIASISFGIINAENDDQYKIKCHGSIFNGEELLNKLKDMLPRFGEDFQGTINVVNSYFGKPNL